MSIEKASLLTDKDVVTKDKVELQQQLIRVEQEKQDLVSEKAGILSCSSYHCYLGFVVNTVATLSLNSCFYVFFGIHAVSSADVTSVDTVMQWREDWSSASVVSHAIVTDPTIRSQASISLVIRGL